MHSVLPTNPSSSTLAPSWANLTREGAHVNAAASLTPPHTTTTADIIELYTRCMASGLLAHFSISHSVGCQNISVCCYLSVSTPARRHRCQRSEATNSVDPAAASHIFALQIPASLPLQPQAPTALSLSLSPPAKRTRKAVKRCC